MNLFLHSTKSNFVNKNIIAKRLLGFHFNNVIIHPVEYLSQDRRYRASHVHMMRKQSFRKYAHDAHSEDFLLRST